MTVAAALIRQGRHDEARRVVMPAAELGDVDAMCQLGLTSISLDQPIDAERWLLAAARRGSTDAKRNLGLFYVHRGDRRRGRVWLARAVEAGDTRSLASLASVTGCWPPGRKAGLARRAAAEGQPAGKALLGAILARRYLFTLKLDRAAGREARALLAEVASLERPRASDRASFGLLLGACGEWDEGEPWLRRAAEAGDHRAAVVLKLTGAVGDRLAVVRRLLSRLLARTTE